MTKALFYGNTLVRAAGQKACLLIAVIWTGGIACAQDISGQWYGVLEGYSAGDPRRLLNVQIRDNKVTCTWDAGGTLVGAQAPCTVTNDSVDLVTAAKNPARLTLEGAALKGSLTFLNRNETHRITMTRAGPEQSVSACEQTISYRLIPAVGLPSSMRAFSGVWLGAFRNWCTVLIVESIGADGTALVRQGWGRSDVNRTGAPGSGTYQALISGNSLTIRKRN